MFWHQRPILITAGSQTETLKPGDAAVLKGWHSVWSEHHLKNSELEPCVLQRYHPSHIAT